MKSNIKKIRKTVEVPYMNIYRRAKIIKYVCLGLHGKAFLWSFGWNYFLFFKPDE